MNHPSEFQSMCTVQLQLLWYITRFLWG